MRKEEDAQRHGAVAAAGILPEHRYAGAAALASARTVGKMAAIAFAFRLSTNHTTACPPPSPPSSSFSGSSQSCLCPLTCSPEMPRRTLKAERARVEAQKGPLPEPRRKKKIMYTHQRRGEVMRDVLRKPTRIKEPSLVNSLPLRTPEPTSIVLPFATCIVLRASW